ncbi:MAG: aryldialkylphosphatase, partial [Marivirga sp.]|nr:aryldialkylphosphatase [Marivirga sp.]
KELKDSGCDSLIDCTPNYLGRDMLLLKKLSDLSGLHLISNTGYYGGSDHKFLPAHAFDETADQLADRWTKEWKTGIDGKGIKPGFMKLSVNPDKLSPVSQKLIEAAAKTHLRTGLTIASHTGPAVAAFEEAEILRKQGVQPDAFIWVHAQTETDKSNYIKAVRSGMWVSLDGLNEDNVSIYSGMLTTLKVEKCLHRILISHDAGWYDPRKPNGGDFRGFTTLFKKLIPELQRHGFSNEEIQQLVRKNPGEAFTIRIRKVT